MKAARTTRVSGRTMGIPIFPILRERLTEIDNELRERFGLTLQTAEFNPKKASILFEYFVLYNVVLSVDPGELRIDLRRRSGPPYLPLPGVKYWKTAGRFGDILEPSIVARREKNTYNFWFDRPLLYFVKGEEASARPDIVVRKGQFEFRDLAFSQEKVQLLREGELIAETGIASLSSIPKEENGYTVLVPSYEWEQKVSYFKFRDEFIHPPLIIECKSYGAVLGNIDKYASHAETVVVVTPEKLYEPKKPNIHVLKIQNKRQLSNQELRQKAASFLLAL
jgi:hypothetical protein